MERGVHYSPPESSSEATLLNPAASLLQIAE